MSRLASTAALLALLLDNAVAAPIVWSDVAPALGLAGEVGALGSGVGTGVALIDVDGDGDLDLGHAPTGGLPRIWRQSEAGWVQGESLLEAQVGKEETGGITAFDMDGDGDDDVLLLRDGPDVLLRNDAGTLVDVSATHLPRESWWGVSAAVGDIDGDGDDDVYVGNYISGQQFPAHFGSPNALLLNDGHGRFTDVAATAGVTGRGCTLAVMMVDVDGDLDLDLLEVNDFGQFSPRNAYYRNDGPDADGQLHFSERGAEAGLADRLYGMGIAVADLGGPSELPLFAMSSIGRPALRARSVVGHYDDVTEVKGAAVVWSPEGYQVTWTPLFTDLNADGRDDLFYSGGYIASASFIKNAKVMPHVLLGARPDGTFELDPKGVIFPLTPGNFARGATLGDLDGDGRPEVVMAHADGRLSVMHRDAGPVPLRVRAHATETGPSASGLLLTATCNGQTRRVHHVGGGPFASRPSLDLWVSLPECPAGAAVDLRARWPSGTTTTHAAMMGDSLTLSEPDWITWTDDSVTLTPRGADGQVVNAGLVLHRADDGAEVPTIWTGTAWTATIAPPTRLVLTIGGQRWPVAIGEAPPTPTLWTQPQHLIAGKGVRLRVRVPGATTLETWVLTADGVALPTTVEGGELTTELMLSDVSHVTFAVAPSSSPDVPLAVWERPVLPPFDPAFSRSRVGGRLQLPTTDAKSMNAVVLLRDRNGIAPVMTSLTYTLDVDGVPVSNLTLNTNGGQALATFPLSAIAPGAVMQLRVNGEALGPAQPLTVLASTDDLPAEVSPTLSECGMSMATAYADGLDTLTALVFLRDHYGNPIPTDGPPPTLAPALGASVDSPETWSADDRHQIVVRSGTLSGLAQHRVLLNGVDLGVICEVLVLPAPAPPESLSAELSTFTVLPDKLPMASTAEAEVRLTPRLPNGRVVGSSAPITLTTSIGGIEELRYAGVGVWLATWTPSALPGDGAITASAAPGGFTMSLPVRVFDPLAPPGGDDVGGDVNDGDAAEPDEGDTATGDAVEGDTVEGDTVEVVDEVEPIGDAGSSGDPSTDVAGPVETPGEDDTWEDTGAEGTSPNAEAALEVDEVDGGAEGDVTTTTDVTSSDAGALDTRVGDASPGPVASDGGCRSVPRRRTQSGLMAVITALGVVVWRRRRERLASDV
ncbi:MAG: VCBS repeat-containing protein [Myxococcales bacterium]|nr:VCBS repeat-containing protein [Myxococcales bacterium]